VSHQFPNGSGITAKTIKLIHHHALVCSSQRAGLPCLPSRDTSKFEGSAANARLVAVPEMWIRALFTSPVSALISRSESADQWRWKSAYGEICVMACFKMSHLPAAFRLRIRM
jgi:hypothetical protein